jgi:hypothetical protein
VSPAQSYACSNVIPVDFIYNRDVNSLPEKIRLIADSLIFVEDFESGEGDWFADSGVWEIGVSMSGPDSAYSGQNLAATVLDGNYPINAHSRLVSPTISLPRLVEGKRIQSKFWHWYSFGGGDQGVVQISVEGGEWQDVSNIFVGESGDWTQYIIDLSAFANSRIRLAFLFTSDATQHCPWTGCHFHTGIGWYLDDVRVEGIQGYAISIEPRSLNFGEVAAMTEITREVTVLNEGSEKLNITSISISGSARDHFLVIPNSLVVAPNSNENLKVTFAPDKPDSSLAVMVLISELGRIEVNLAGLSGANVSTEPQ